MQKLLTLWNWFDGKKTSIGAAILVFAFVLQQVDTQVIVGIWQVPVPAWLDKSILTLEWVGTAFSGVGLFHKATK